MANFKMHLIIYILVAMTFSYTEGALEDKLHYYEIPTVTVHTISKRSTDKSIFREVQVSAFGSNFTLKLRPAKNLFNKDFQVAIIHGDGSKEMLEGFDMDKFMTGHVKGEVNSQASLHIGDNNLVTGMFTSGGQEYGIEPISNHADGEEDKFHDKSTMVIYKRTDIKSDSENPGLCGSVHPESLNGEPIEEVNFKKFEHDHHRQKRAAGPADTCMLVAVADYKYFSHLGQSNRFTTASYISNIINRINLIYRTTNFGVGVGYGFELRFMVIHDQPSTSSNEYYYNIAKNDWFTGELLEVFSRTLQYSEYCMAMLFTSQPMPDSILGLAYIASASFGNLGGLCSPTGNVNGQQLTLNTGWTTARNGGGNTLTFTQHALVTAHGHGWGSEHDPESGNCAPRTTFGDGKYLMYPYAVTGEDPNNDVFSSCSRGTIGAVLSNKASACLQAASIADPCGNGLIDDGEECDGGFLGRLGLDLCCSNECLLNPGSTCSAANYACCVNCQLASEGYLCQGYVEGSCTGDSFCDGNNLVCPPAPKLGTSVSCLDNGTCLNGECTPFCEFRGLNSCLCDTVETSCKRCCRDPSTGQCSVYNNDNLQEGRSCIQGYCQNGVCVKVNTDMIERLWDLIDEISIDFLVESFRTNMVGCVTGFSLVLYIPICIVIYCVDYRRKKKWEHENEVHVRKDRTLAHDEDKRPIEIPEKPKPESSRPSVLDPSEFLSPSFARRPNNQIQPLEHRAGVSNA